MLVRVFALVAGEGRAPHTAENVSSKFLSLATKVQSVGVTLVVAKISIFVHKRLEYDINRLAGAPPR